MKVLFLYKINGWYLFHCFFRNDVFTNVLFLASIWVYYSGGFLIVLMAMFVLISGNDSLLRNISSLPTDFDDCLLNQSLTKLKMPFFVNFMFFLVQIILVLAKVGINKMVCFLQS